MYVSLFLVHFFCKLGRQRMYLERRPEMARKKLVE
jgi:hypothetical protein